MVKILQDVLDQIFAARRHVGALVMAFDPDSQDTSDKFQEEFGFMETLEAKVPGRPVRLWRRLEP